MQARNSNRTARINAALRLALIVGLIFLKPIDGQATRWTLVRFGTNDASCQTPYGDWTNVFRHPTRSHYVDPDGNPNHAGITEVEALPEGTWAYYGVRGTSPVLFRRGHKIIATFYNRTDEYAFLTARVSFTDENEPDPDGAGPHWFTLQNRRYRDNRDWMPPGESVEMELDLADGDGINAIDGLASVGDYGLVNISKPYNDTHFALNRIEWSDEADWTPPNPPQNLAAKTISTTAGANPTGRQIIRADVRW